ncbi:DUF6221 family protein [Streptomyces sp. NPDC001939]
MEFLTARLREDETAAKALKPGKNQDVARLRDRVLADVEAKRRLLDWVYEPQWIAQEWGRSFWQRVVADSWMDRRKPVIYALLAAYADHPDFHFEWKQIEDEPGEDAIPTRAHA